MNNAVNHRNMRILLILILSAFSFAFCFGTFKTEKTLAEPIVIPEIVVNSKVVHRGQTFSLDIDISNNVIGLTSLFITPDYDDTVMTLKNVIKGDALSTLTLTTTNVETELGYNIKPFNIMWDGDESDYSNGTIVTLIFDTSIDAEIGEYPVTLTFDRQNTNTAYKTPTDVNITDGVINLIKGEYQAIYRDYDGTVLFSKDYNADDIPSYPEDYLLPQRPDDAEYTYEFIGWKGVISDDINTLIYEADYKLTPNVYSIFFYIDGYKGRDAENEENGVIDVEDYLEAKEFAYGSFIEFPDIPFQQYYVFYGWYVDENFTTPIVYGTMPSHDLRLYGFFKYEVRETNIPLIHLNMEQHDAHSVTVTAELIRNTGINGLVLTLDYDLSALQLKGFNNETGVLSKMQASTTNIAKLNEPNFKFYFEYSENCFETGEFLELYFDIIDTEATGIHTVTFTYDYHSDATYIDAVGEIKYTKLEIVGVEIPVGEINHWTWNTDTGRSLDVTSQDGKPINVKLSVEFVTESIYISQEKIESVVGKNMYLQSAYSIKLMQNSVEIEPQTILVIRIKLSENEQRCKKLKFYYYNDDLELEEHEFTVDGTELVFRTNHLSNWLIFGDYNPNKVFESEGRVVMLVMYPILLAIITMTYTFIQKSKITKLKNSENQKEEAHNE